MNPYRTLTLASILTLAGAVASCSNSSSTTGSGGTSSSATGSASGGSGGSPSKACPTALPTSGAACSNEGQACEYGGDAERLCTSVAQCTSGAWSIHTPPASCGQQPASCPATFGAVAQGTTCAADGPLCEYPEGFCGCEVCSGDGGVANGAIWHCNAWAAVIAACPTMPRPRLGEACSTEGQECDYGYCCSGPALGPYMKCQGGAWIPWENGACSCSIATCP